MTTPPPTIVGFPRRLGSSRCSTEAKNASASACRIDAAAGTNVCSHRKLAGSRPVAGLGPRKQPDVEEVAEGLARVGLRQCDELLRRRVAVAVLRRPVSEDLEEDRIA